MARPSRSATVRPMIDILRLINDLAPASFDEEPRPVPLAEFAQRLSLDESQVVKFIDKINYGCGDAAPEMLVFYDEDERTVTPYRVGGAFDRPIRLTPEEARGTLAALETAGYAEGEVAERIRGAFPSVSRDAIVAGNSELKGHPSLVRVLTSAARLHKAVEIRYMGMRDESAKLRVIEPYWMRFDGSDDGAWYVLAWCRSSNGWRTFRLDRMESARMTDDVFEVRDENLEPELSGAVEAVMAVHDPTALLDAYDWHGLERVSNPRPEDAARLSDADVDRGGYIATIPWAENSPWLSRSLLRCGGRVEVLRPQRLRDAVSAEAKAALCAVEAAHLE